MKTFLRLTTNLFLFSLLIACSPIDSLKPFDQTQAALVLQQHYTSKAALQMIVFNLPQKARWKKIDLSINRKGTPVMLIPQNETQKWTESVRTFILGYQDIPNATPLSTIREETIEARAKCKVANLNIITSGNSYVLYQLNLQNCIDRKDQIQFGKALRGQDAIYMVYYTAITNRVSQQEIQIMKRAIESAQLIASR